jgi:hypothetical protein
MARMGLSYFTADYTTHSAVGKKSIFGIQNRVGKYEYVGGDKFIPVHKAAKGGRAVFVSL